MSLRILSVFFYLLPLTTGAQTFTSAEIARWEAQARNVTIHEDQWGIPHVYGKTDADAVFGLLYVQCQQNFPRVERNYLEIMGRLSEVEGEGKVWEDLQMRLLYDSAGAKKDYAAAPLYFRKLLDAFADGVNYYLYKHPAVKPAVLQRFEPWFPLMYTDGSIAPTQTGGLTLNDLKEFYGSHDESTSSIRHDLTVNGFNPSSSNGFAIGPKKSASGNAMLYINPHVTFYFRTEAHMVSDEGLNAYGAVTWGQFFIYQGFNEHCGWMHTSSYADVADVYEEKVSDFGSMRNYTFNNASKSFDTATISIGFRDSSGVKTKTFTRYRTLHGPVMGRRNGKVLSLKENNRSMLSLIQSWLRTKAKGLEDYKKAMDMRANNSNNTVFADNKGNIAYWHGNFMPKRNPKYDWSLPVDGSIPATEWQGLHTVAETVHLYNPASGWIQNCNSTPFTAAGTSSPVKSKYPIYMAPDGQNGRALNAIRLLSGNTKLSIDNLIAMGYNRRMSAFDVLIPALLSAYDSLPTDIRGLDKNVSLRTGLKEPLALLSGWSREADTASIATTMAIEWAQKAAAKIPPAKTTEAATNTVGNFARMAALPKRELLAILDETLYDLKKTYGTWRIPWGDINRYQRTVNNSFNDSAPSLPVGLGPGTWGSLPSYVSRRTGTAKRYGVSGNSFVAAVEFGPRLKAKTIMTGGESFNPQSPHYTDQAEGFINGTFKDINFYKEDVLKNSRRSYRPGE